METIYTNCSVITRHAIFPGTVVVTDGQIKEVDNQPSSLENAIDMGGDYLLPGLIEMHTDNLEKNIQPRPGVIWPSIMSATLAHDNQIISSGITTVYDAVAVGGLRHSSLRSKILSGSVEAICRGNELRILKADHFIHLRCEVADEHMEEMLDDLSQCPITRLVSVMDHTPGQRQWRDLNKWRRYHRDKKWSDEEAAAILSDLNEMQERYGAKHRLIATSFAKEHNIPLASHDDTTVQDAVSAAAEGVSIAEFPTTIEAAAKANELGMKTIMGAPNALRGTSHSGNISARILAENNLLDGLSSDYVPNSLLHSAFHLADNLHLPLQDTVAMVTANVADMVGLEDRGEITPGKAADLLQVQVVDELPVIKKVWKCGIGVA